MHPLYRKNQIVMNNRFVMFRQWSVRHKNRVSKIIVSKYWSFFFFLELKKCLFCTLASKHIDKGGKKRKSPLQSWVKLVFFLQQWRCRAVRHCAVERSLLPCCKQDKLKSYSLTQSRICWSICACECGQKWKHIGKK